MYVHWYNPEIFILSLSILKIKAAVRKYHHMPEYKIHKPVLAKKRDFGYVYCRY